MGPSSVCWKRLLPVGSFFCWELLRSVGNVRRTVVGPCAPFGCCIRVVCCIRAVCRIQARCSISIFRASRMSPFGWEKSAEPSKACGVAGILTRGAWVWVWVATCRHHDRSMASTGLDFETRRFGGSAGPLLTRVRGQHPTSPNRSVACCIGHHRAHTHTHTHTLPSRDCY